MTTELPIALPNTNLQPYQQLALFARDDELSNNERFDLLTASILLGGQQISQNLENHHQANLLNQEQIESLKARISKYEARDQKRINEILDRAIADYQRRGHGCVTGASLSGAGMIASLLLGPFAVVTIPAIAVAARASINAADQEYSFEQKLREAKANGDFKNADPEDLPEVILEMKQKHNEAMQKQWEEQAKKHESSSISDCSDHFEICFNEISFNN